MIALASFIASMTQNTFFFDFSEKLQNCWFVKSSFLVSNRQITRYNIYSFSVWRHGLKDHSFIHFSCITIPHRVVFLGKSFVKIIINFWDVPTILKSLLNWALWAFLTFSQLCLAYPVLKISQNWKKKHNFLRVKDKLAVLP